MQSDDPTDVRSLAVHREDVVTALEANERRDAGVVLRATPPFAGRMRARIHRTGPDDPDADPAPLCVDPAALVSDPPPYPTVDATEDELRADPTVEYTPERHRERHVAAVETWRDAVGERLVEEAVVETPAGPHRVAVAVLG